MSKTYRIGIKNMKTREDLEELELWLSTFDLHRPTKKIHRDFSDGTLVAKLLHIFYPKFVDMNNYPSRNSISLKFSNWETLNRKVLRKIGLEQTTKQLMNYANSESGAIEKFLLQLKRNRQKKIKECKHNNSDENGEAELEENLEIMTINVSKQIGNGIVQIPQKMILYSLYDNLRQELMDKQKMCEKFKQRVDHLENRMSLKDQRIDELMRTVASQSIRKFVLECGGIGADGTNSAATYKRHSNSNSNSNINVTGTEVCNKKSSSTTDVTSSSKVYPTPTTSAALLKAWVNDSNSTGNVQINNNSNNDINKIQSNSCFLY